MNLKRLNWNPQIHRRLERLAASGRQGDLAVFDWDNTCMFGDIGDSFFRHQILHLDLRLSNRQLAALLPERIGKSSRMVLGGKTFSLPVLKARILENYCQLEKRDLSYSRCRRQPAYHDFVLLMLLLWQGLEHTVNKGTPYAYPWLTGFLQGFRPEEIRHIAGRLFQRLRRLGILRRAVTDFSHALSCSWLEGVRIYPEMKDLMTFLKSRGFTIVVVTATAPVIVEGVLHRTGHAVDRLIGMSTEVKKGLLTAHLDRRLLANYGKGKAENILRLCGREPLLVAGDSDGDVAMLTRFPATRVRLIIDCGLQGEIEILYQKARVGEDGYMLQAIDLERGAFLPR